MILQKLSLFKKSIIVLFLFIIVFYFGYYNIGINIENVNKSFFITKYENLDLNNDDNLYVDLRGFEYEMDLSKNIKEEMVLCLYKKECYGNINDYKNNIGNDKGNFNYKNGRIKITDKMEKLKVILFLKKNIEKLYEFENSEHTDNMIDKLIYSMSKKKFFKYNLDNEDDVFFYNFLSFNLDLKYKILYYLNNDDEKKAIEILKSQLETFVLLLNGDNNYISTQNAINYFQIGLDNSNFFLDNFNISIESKKILLETLEKNIDEDIMDNTLKNYHKNLIISLDNIDSVFFDKEYTEGGFAEIHANKIKNEGILLKEVYSKYDTYNIFKKNQVGQLLWLGEGAKWGFWGNLGIDRSYKEDYVKIQELKEIKDEIIEKLKNSIN